MPQRTIAENPWFWLALFGGVGLLGVMLIAPKFGARWSRVERMQETRERVAQEKTARLAAGGTATAVEQQNQPQPPKSTDAPPEPEPYVESDFQQSMPLRYLLCLMMVVMMVGTTGLLITRGRERRAALMSPPTPTAASGPNSVATANDSSKADA